MAGEKILIIDPSEEDVRALADEVLYPEGYVVVHALDGEEGLRQAMDGNPDVIVAEFATPRRPGLDILAQLRQAGREVPFILIGLSSSVETLKRALRMGVVDYLFKPLDLDEARTAIERALARRMRPLPDTETSLLARGFERINRQLERRVRELSILHNIGKAVTSIRDLERLLNRIVEAAVYLTGAEEGFLLLIDEETHELYIRASQGLGEKLATSLRIKSEDSLSWQVVQIRKPIMISSVTDEEQFKLKTGYLVKALLHVPLNLRGEVIGVLSVDNKIARRSFNDNDLQLLSALADYAAVAIDNVQQYERAETEAAKLAALLKTHGAGVIPGEPQVETVPLDWLVEELQAQKEKADEGLKETEQLARELAARASSVEQLVEQWRNQRLGSEELARRLADVEVAVPGRGTQVPATAPIPWRSILDNLAEGLIVTDRQGFVRAANRVAARLLGTDRVIGQDLRSFSADPRWIESVDRLRANDVSGESAGPEATFWRNGCLIRANFVSLSEETEENGEWAVILSDLGRERAIQSASDNLNSIISQKLRTPMTVIASYADLLLTEAVGLLVPNQRRLLESVQANLTRMGEVVDGLTTVSPVAPDVVRETLGPVDVGLVIERAVDDAASWFSSKDLNVELDLARDLPRAIVEPDCAYQMVINLLQNAVRATPAGGVVLVRARASQDRRLKEQASFLVISVRDQGGGIAPEFLGQVFERFYSEQERPIPGLGGKGVELSLVKRLVETFGGRVWVETEPGIGSTFSLILPALGNG